MVYISRRLKTDVCIFSALIGTFPTERGKLFRVGRSIYWVVTRDADTITAALYREDA